MLSILFYKSTYFIKHTKCIRIVTLVLLILHFQLENYGQQQVEHTMSQYFQNRIMWNAGFTGVKGSKIYLLQNRSWIGFIGAPIASYISGEFAFGANSAVGLQLMTDRIGLIQRNSEMLSYSYRIKLSKEKQIRIGVSLNFKEERLRTKDIDPGGVLDPLIVNHIEHNWKADGSLGFVYLDRKLTFGLSICQLSENLRSASIGNANLAIAKIGGYYQFTISEDGKIKANPIWMFRIYRITNPVADIGVQFDYDKFLNTMVIYQTTGNIRAGIGAELKKFVMANFFYNTNVRIASAASQQFEIGIGFNLRPLKTQE